MSRWQKWTMVAVLMAAVAIPATVTAADAAAAKPAAPAAAPAAPAGNEHLAGAWLDAFHKPFDGFTMGLDIRLREEYAPNFMSMDKNQGDGALPGPDNSNQWNRQRYRARWSMSYAVTPDVDINARLVWEMSTFRHTPGQQHRDDEIIPDILNVTWRNAFNLPMTLVIGRQEIMNLGNGWLVFEGTPNDGSRTHYFDAARATINLSDRTTVDLIGINNYDDEDKWLHPLNHNNVADRRHAIGEKQDEVGGIVYITDKWSETTKAEYYYIYKQDEPSTWGKFYSTSNGLDDEIHTIGAALSGKLNEKWGYRTEFAKQFGKVDMESMSAWGTNNRLTYAFKDERNAVLNFDYEYMSGDDPDTRANEQFDPLWGQWPQSCRGGDLPLYMWTSETSTGEVTNLHRAGVGYTFDLCPKWTLQTNYNLLWADQEYRDTSGNPSMGPTGTQFSRDGLFRGQMITGYLRYKCCKNLSMHFLADYFVPGTFYSGSSQDHAIFLRYNLEFTF